MERRLKKAGYEPVFFKHSPRVDGIFGAAEKLAKMLHQMQNHDIHFVTHSMGGLVLRAVSLQNIDSRHLRRAILIAPPNRGAIIMRKITSIQAGTPLWKLLYGEACHQLQPEGMAMTLPAPPCEFGIIAGGRNHNRGFSPLLSGDNDGTVTVASTILDGAHDFIILPHLHTSILWADDTIDETIAFLHGGVFLKPKIPADAVLMKNKPCSCGDRRQT